MDCVPNYLDYSCHGFDSDPDCLLQIIKRLVSKWTIVDHWTDNSQSFRDLRIRNRRQARRAISAARLSKLYEVVITTFVTRASRDWVSIAHTLFKHDGMFKLSHFRLAIQPRHSRSRCFLIPRRDIAKQRLHLWLGFIPLLNVLNH